MNSDLTLLMKWNLTTENLCTLHKNNQKYCSKSEEFCVMTIFLPILLHDCHPLSTYIGFIPLEFFTFHDI